ncbi:WecB/TagA/CpsF family glycosyltransferase [Pseudooceanicola sediminis]|uniref:WecB/TagA/CpsF family glycosyltransferase n=2 Tax=Pseudooceanicola sediminis TaxID=2211117 RepID=A0A399J749_9RHOB|nr:WecB/TagA/CpsF family glycosyltransferase [Puniceibacterium sp. HSS470]RII40079.1 WecB/TagA/CpsF family glycosyltransferase [Pseudooceanicola sediminis]|tara:strand:+ start:32757 stop:34145 length:1389 start_codon:yes stop_codon:yes gene_type:complete
MPAPRPALDALNAFAPRQSRLSHVSLFGLDLVSGTTAAVIHDLLHTTGRRRVAFLNAHCGNVMARDATYADALATADMILPDGIGIELAARFCGARFAENLNGTDFTPALLKAAAAKGLGVYLLGARPGVAEAAARQLCLSIPGLRIVGTRDGYDGMADEDAVIAAINAARPDILITALGVPMQDVWLARNAHRLDARITMGVGALLDFLAGRVRRAPALVRRARAEWAWRLACEPRRMARRYLAGNVTFLARAAAHAVGRVDGYGLRRRVMDIASAGAAVALLAPVALVLAAAIRIESGGPVLFRQTRIGRNGKPFTMYKFRSMYADAEQRRAALLATSDREGICFKSRNDPRVTRVGRLLRRLSLDELPQLLNILRGDMSIVGPRPALPEEVAAYPDRALGRLAVNPGLTGIWQVSGRAEIGFDRMVDMDLAYADARSTLLDLVIMAMTFRAVVGGRGAY